MRIYVDESGTHDEKWLIIGALFVPDHGLTHSELCKNKEDLKYFNASPKRPNTRYKEVHLSDFRSPRDVAVGSKWVDTFVAHTCWYRAVVIDWKIWDGSYFGTWYEADALKKRKAYKKWAEMLLTPELVEGHVKNATLYLDRLRVVAQYDVLDHLRIRFAKNYDGGQPCIRDYQHTDSWRDANQCLQLCDLLTGGLYQHIVPAESEEKTLMRLYLEAALKPVGVKNMSPSFFRGFSKNSLRRHLPKFSAWFWRPE
jgi:hypothetical protein